MTREEKLEVLGSVRTAVLDGENVVKAIIKHAPSDGSYWDVWLIRAVMRGVQNNWNADPGGKAFAIMSLELQFRAIDHAIAEVKDT